MEIDNIRTTFDVLENLRPVLDGLAVLTIPIGLLLLFVGWKFYNWFVALPGIILGAVIGFAAAQGEGVVGSLVGIVVGAFIGGGIASFLHGFTIWGIFALIGGFLIEGIWTDLFSSDAPSELLVFGSIIVGVIGSVIYGRFLGLIAAFIGSAMLGNRLGFGGVFIFIVAAIGFWVQYNLACSWGDDVFRRQSVRKRRKAERNARREKRKVDRTDSDRYDPYNDSVSEGNFDATAEIEVIED
jgi:hypothetical protein